MQTHSPALEIFIRTENTFKNPLLVIRVSQKLHKAHKGVTEKGARFSIAPLELLMRCVLRELAIPLTAIHVHGRPRAKGIIQYESVDEEGTVKIRDGIIRIPDESLLYCSY